ncbi:S8 family serine peptidase [Rossellomorea aquimaris]|uniref:S8 family serine peptidase n=2 Tax=Rossellomorea aquimaris TaxID=189382 RepID=A0A5D4TLT9_9BACI|nr:S8 family serine peptidase [Rossellomorea aquimaris]TYS83635.1 S8 family serine peptidase [Rossellomorea aquimaris]TYS89184.1 S8 family serine peptidase [Rossellomorea aquimaris]
MNISPDKKEGKRRMKKRITKNVTMLALSAGLVGSSLAPATLSHQVHAEPSSGIDQVLSKLTPEQRQAIKQLQTNDQGGLQLSPEVDQKSNDSISVIVQFKDKPEKTAVLEAELEGKNLSRTKAKEKVDAAHETFQKDLQKIFKNELKQKKSSFKIKQSYKNAFNGVAMTIPANKAKELLDSKEVKAVWSDLEVHVEPPVTEQEKSEKNTEPNRMTTFPGIERLHHEGFTGEGVKVGILDTGIDYNHPDLKDAYKGGFDFVDNDNDPMETTYEDWVKAGKPHGSRDYFTQHGTHVAGIVAGQGANESDLAVTGVAPDADIYAYRVLGPFGTGSTGAILAGIDQAVEDGMDVLNMSLGANYNDPLYVTSIAVNNAVLAGVTAVVSAGNSGNNMYTLGSPGTSPLALTVGANDTSVTIPTFKGTLHTDTNVSADLKMVARGFDDNIEELKGQNLSIVDGGTGSFPEDVDGKVVLAARGYVDLNAMINNAKKGGAKALLLYNAIPLQDVYLGEGFDSIPVFSLSDEQGNAMKQALTSGNATFSFDELVDPVVTGGDVLADFSSRGPSRVLYDIKPEVTAPGVSVMSTVPSYMHGEDQIGNYQYAYESLSGTSMAAPNVAGVAALLKQTDPDMTPAEIKTRLMNTAAPLNGEYSVFEVGAGRVDPYKAIHAQTNIQVNDETETSDGGAKTLADEGIHTIKDTTGALSFGAHAPDGKHLRETRSVALYNNSNETKTFDVKVEFQTLEERFEGDYSRVANDAVANGVTLETKDTLKVKPGKKKKTAVTMLVPKTAELGNYEGYVVYTNKDNPDEMYRVPFGIHTVEEGIDHIEASPPAFTVANEHGFNGIKWSVALMFQLKSHMRSLDLFLVDPKTNEEFGFLGSFDGMGANENIEYRLGGAMNEGFYYPLTGDPENPVAYDTAQVEPGLYKIKMVGTNDTGKTFTADTPVYFNVTQPTLDLNVDSGVYEYSPDQTTVPLTGSVYDPGVEEMKAAGMDVTQANNKFVYQYGRFATEVPLDAEGNFSTELTLSPGVSVLPVKMYAENMATVQNYSSFKQVYYVKEGTQYGTAIPDKKKVTAGDTVTYTLSMNNMENMKQAEYSFINPLSTFAEVVSIKPHETLNGKVDIQTVDTDVEIDGATATKTDITATLTGDAPQTGVNGTTPMVDVTYKVKEDTGSGTLNLEQFKTSYTNTDDTVKSVDGISIPYRVERTHSVLKSWVYGEAFRVPVYPELDEPLSNVDYVKAGAKVKVTDETGKEYANNLGESAITYFFRSELPLTDKPFTLEVDLPGHFTVKRTFTVGLKEDGEIKPFTRIQYFQSAHAGDVNKDNVIDVNDALYIQSNWNTDKREADINFDGVVDAKDMQFVINNYLIQNPWMDNSPEPVKTHNGHTLESVLEELNIQ